MTKVLLTESYLENIADAIRAKNGTQDTYTPGEMSEAINNIESVGDYFNTTISSGSYGSGGYKKVYKNLIPNTVQNTGTSCNYMFQGYTGNNISTLPNFNTTNVTSMEGMFRDCSNLTSLDISNFNTNNISGSMNGMFMSCPKLESINFPSTFHTGSNIDGLFLGTGIESIDLTGFDTSRTTSMQTVFKNCASLKSVDLSSWDISKAYTMGGFFEGCSNLETVNLNVKVKNNSNSIPINDLFYNCGKLQSVDLRNFVTNIVSADFLFNGCGSLETINMDGVNLGLINGQSSNLGAFRSAFKNCNSLVNLIFGNNLGAALSSSSSVNQFNVDLTSCSLLTHDSLVDFLTKLADVSDKGAPVAVTTVRLGATNLAKLTAEEIAIATNKGWTVS